MLTKAHTFDMIDFWRPRLKLSSLGTGDFKKWYDTWTDSNGVIYFQGHCTYKGEFSHPISDSYFPFAYQVNLIINIRGCYSNFNCITSVKTTVLLNLGFGILESFAFDLLWHYSCMIFQIFTLFGLRSLMRVQFQKKHICGSYCSKIRFFKYSISK